ncbi:hypothetical protein [Dyella sp.]|uniref:hypothetical protein n=1 Tax=Dyella sp. TaxID=1869338 RepID=UPI002B493159|nr:hypothetical protein [Dyella sp.]HKT28785.1 hypothetical protein [Dyella sp.]
MVLESCSLTLFLNGVLQGRPEDIWGALGLPGPESVNARPVDKSAVVLASDESYAYMLSVGPGRLDLSLRGTAKDVHQEKQGNLFGLIDFEKAFARVREILDALAKLEFNVEINRVAVQANAVWNEDSLKSANAIVLQRFPYLTSQAADLTDLAVQGNEHATSETVGETQFNLLQQWAVVQQQAMVVLFGSLPLPKTASAPMWLVRGTMDFNTSPAVDVKWPLATAYKLQSELFERVTTKYREWAREK